MAMSSPTASAIGTLGASMRGMLPLAVCFAVLFAVSFLPPDTSLRHVQEAGRISVCMPVDYPPLVSREPDRPGFDVELIREIAARSHWRLSVVSNAAMGRDFNPRSWRITRAQCQMLAGGIALSTTTRSFLDTSGGHLLTGWVTVASEGQDAPFAGQRVGFYAGLTGIDRVPLGRYLRALDVETSFVPTAAALRSGLENGEFDRVITEALIAHQVFDPDHWEMAWLPEELGRFPVGIGFWRGDTTLRRHVEGLLATLADEGFLLALADRYGLSEEVLCGMRGASC